MEVPLKVITETKIEEFVGAGRLEVEHGGVEPTYLYYSNSLIPKFAEVAEAIKQLTKGEPLTLPTEIERSPVRHVWTVAARERWNLSGLREKMGYTQANR